MDFNKLGAGCLPDPIDIRDYIYRPLGVGAFAVDWVKGYDIESIVGKIKPKNQFSSSACVGQATSYYVSVCERLETGKLDEISAKAIYSQITLGKGKGAYLRDGMKLIKEWGSVFENIVKSYRDNGTTDEDFMIDKSWKTEEIDKLAKVLQAKDYKLITGIGIDIFANAIKDGHGALMGVMGTNNGTWTSEFPQPPTLETPQNALWGHALYAGKFKMINGKKYIGVINSWGNVGKDGWQWLGEEWFADNGRWIFNPWTLIDKKNINDNNMRLVKSSNSTNTTVFLIDALGNRRVFFNEKHFASVAPALGLAKQGTPTDWSNVELLTEEEINKFPLANPLYEVNG